MNDHTDCNNDRSAFGVNVYPEQSATYPPGTMRAEPLANPVTEFWSLHRMGQLLPSTIQPVVRIRPHVIPPYVHDFVNAIRKIDHVKCIVAEDGEDITSLHVTTFAQQIDDELRDRVYEIEADIIENNPDVIFDFHLRRAEAAEPAASSSLRHVFMIWGSLHATAVGA